VKTLQNMNLYKLCKLALTQHKKEKFVSCSAISLWMRRTNMKILQIICHNYYARSVVVEYINDVKSNVSTKIFSNLLLWRTRKYAGILSIILLTATKLHNMQFGFFTVLRWRGLRESHQTKIFDLTQLSLRVYYY